MLIPFLIMMREGIEAALIVGLVASYLKQAGQPQWLPAVWVGAGLAALLCLALGVMLDRASAQFPQREQELFEALVGFAAVGILTSMVFWMKKAAHSIKAQLHDSIDAALRSSERQSMALVGIVFLAVAREGLESVFFLLATFQQNVGWQAPVGAIAGLLVAIAVGIGIYYGGIKLNLRHFFRWTGVFILFVAAGLLAGSLRALHEAGLWNGLQDIAFNLSAILPSDSPLGTILAGIFGYDDTPRVGEVLIYCLFLVPALTLFLVRQRPRTEISPGKI